MPKRKMLKHLGEAARNTRQAAGLKPIHVAVVLGRDTSTIIRFENGMSQPRNLDDFLEAYCEVVSCDPAALWEEALSALLDD